MELVIKNQALEKAFAECLSAYAERYPEHWAALLKIVQEEAQNLIKPSGMSYDGSLLTYCKIPEHLYSAMKFVLRKHCGIDDVWRDPKHYQLLCKVATDLHIKKRPQKRLYIKTNFD